MRNDFGIRPRPKLKAGGRVKAKHGGRAKKQLGGVGAVGAVGGVGAPVGTARRDMRSGYYPNDMGMQGGPMYKKGGSVKKKKQKKQGYKAKKDESLADRFGKGKGTKKERDLAYGKWGKRRKDWKKA